MSTLRNERIFAASGFALLVILLIGFWPIAGFVPPPSPHESASQIAHFFAGNTTGIHLGLWITMLSGTLCVPWAVAVTHQMRRIEGRLAPLADAQLVLGALFVLEIIVPLMIWQAADFRPLESIVTTQRLNDLAWLMFVGLVSTGVLQAVVIGWAILQDRSPTPILPRWLGYLSLWVALLFMPAGLTVFFKHGPLAWNGLISWYILLGAFCVWVVAISTMVLRAINDQMRAELAATRTTSDLTAEPAVAPAPTVATSQP